MLYLFEDFALDTERRELRRESRTIPVQPQVFDLLEYLIRHRERVASKDDLIAAVWGGRIVSESALTTRINAARTAIGDSGEDQRLIKTLPRKGVRFVGAVQEAAGSTAPPLEETRRLELTAAPHVKAGPAERRQLTVASCELMLGVTAARMDPEDLREIIDRYHDCIAETAHRHNGYIANTVGNTALICFGYPQAHEDDAEGAARAGLDLIATLKALKSPISLQTRIGIATGVVVVGDHIGSGGTQTPSIVGETPNLAARLQSIADPNTVVIAEDTRQLLGNLFDLQDLGTQNPKGVAESMRVFAVLRPSSVEGRFEALHGTGLTELVGREEERELLLRRWSRVKTGEGQVVLLSGEAGIGKSRLTAALIEKLAEEPLATLRYFCSPQHTDSALYPIISQMERTAGFAFDDAPQAKLDKLEMLLARTMTSDEDAALLVEMLSLPNDGRYPVIEMAPRQRRQRTLEALVSQMAVLADAGALLIIFEDVHWVDPTSHEVLATMVESFVERPILLVITARPEFTPPWPNHSHTTLITLARLTRRDGTKLVEQVAGGRALPSEVMDQIVARADGVPLFLEELTKTVLESDLLEERNGQYVLSKPIPMQAIPTTLHASLMARLDRSALAKEIAQIGAAIGREFSYSLLRAVTAVDEAALNDALSRLEESELASCRGRPPEAIYSFRHALVQDIAYSSLLKMRRQALHRQIAEALRDKFSALAQTEPEIIAHHFTQAGLPDHAIEWWTKAGEQALRRSAYAEAVAHYRKAIGVADDLGEGPQPLRRRHRLQIACGQALISARGHGAPETTTAFNRARELAATIDDPAERFSVYYGLWAGGYVRGEHATMAELAAIMQREIESHSDSPEAVVAYRVIGTTAWIGGDYVNARKYLERAVAVLPRESDGSLAMRFGQDPAVSALFYFALVLFGLGEIDHARALGEEAFDRALRSGHTPTIVYGQFLRTTFEVMAAGPESTAPFASATLTLGREHGMPVWIAVGTFYDSWARRFAGDHARVLSELCRGLALCYEVGVLNWIAQMVVMQSCAEADAGHIDDGLSRINAFLAETQPIKQRWLDAELHRHRGSLLLRRIPAETETAEAAFQNALAVARSQRTKTFELRAAVALARLWRDQGKRNAARNLLTPVYGWFTQGFDTADLKQAKDLLDELSS